MRLFQKQCCQPPLPLTGEDRPKDSGLLRRGEGEGVDALKSVSIVKLRRFPTGPPHPSLIPPGEKGLPKHLEASLSLGDGR